MTATWLFPAAAVVVASASGSVVATSLPDPQHKLVTIIASYVLWGTGIPLAMTTLVLYLHRLTIHHLPPKELIVSMFLPLGPLGQGGFAIMYLGKVSSDVFPKTNSVNTSVSGASHILYTVGFLVALIMWGYGLLWMFFAVASIARRRFPFNMGWWSFVYGHVPERFCWDRTEVLIWCQLPPWGLCAFNDHDRR